eukprot:CAMPEP_0184742334 /NCGR_PEP_ID=MMETSP0315-20130426/5282_1 /TAXON_ID=101924 /ORGANISM="Rhodosorus marinus, Strain UTEX LB 2760" /LENGTH=650 /DNA_ID=CAMNT_0027213089 /DNA_START=127 /DNA_END=2079 /DNA_ORIENTATION=+
MVTSTREVGSLVIENVPPFSESLVMRLDQYQNHRACVFASWGRHENGKPFILIRTRFSETMQVHRVDRPLGMRYQHTFCREPVAFAQMNPIPERNQFAILKDYGGSELYQVYVFTTKSAFRRRVSTGKGRQGGVRWSHSGDKLIYSSTARNGRDWDIVIQKIPVMFEKDGGAELVRKVEMKGMWMPLSISRDDEVILLCKIISSKQSEIWSLRGEELTKLKAGTDEEPIVYGRSAQFSYQERDDGSYLAYYTTDQGSEFQRLYKMRFHPTNGLIEDSCLTNSLEWDVEEVAVSLMKKTNEDVVAYVVNEDGASSLHLLIGESDSKFSNLPIGQIYGLQFLHDDEPKLALTVNGPHTPGDAYVLDIGAMSIERWTESEVGGLNPSTFVIPERVRVRSFDELDVPAFVYKPKKKCDGGFPVVIHIHGGPESQSVPSFSPTSQAMVELLGCCVIDPNVRGSVGYGKTYIKLDDGYKREDSVKDIGAVLDWIKTQSDLNPEKVAVFGGSYGGYMVLACMIRYGDRLMCGAEIVGISNFVTFLENTSDYRRDHRRGEYGDERDSKMREFLNKISPLTNVNKINKPMLIAQGRNDPRVPESESVQVRDAIRENGLHVWYILAKDEGHGFRKKQNRDFWNAALFSFLQEHLVNNLEN